ncbi:MULTISPECIES: 3-oxoadipate enol-lactonase [unclassified Pseudonocardia]|uniref:3-oxoadipate enol-lactonase n=1 Tax=unclassified Pseudonocardia TaxID=2619320 RepID=UPI000A695DF2|nr:MULTISPECIES: 3-oxoadipate enol-lactonase [unclassified Pseudonocardia]
MTSLEQRIARLETLEEIRTLDARYCRALDDGDWDTLVSLFTDDGEFTGLGHARGRPGLRRFFAGLAGNGLTAFWHHVTNLEIELDGGAPGRARARSFLWQPCVLDGVPHVAAGRYTDTLVRVAGAWRYRSKQVSFDYFAPLDEGWDRARFTVDAAAGTRTPGDTPEPPRPDHAPIALHHRTDGPADGPVLVLGPSLGTDLHLFDAQVAELASAYRIVRYDLPGHGGSPAPDGPYTVAGLARDVLALLDGLGIGRFHHAGVSLGGAIGLQLALDRPDRVASLTVVASAARFAEPSEWPRRARVVRAQGTGAMVTSRPGTWFTHDFVRRRNGEAVRLLAMLQATTAEGYAGCCEAIGEFDVRRRLAGITAPTLAVAGAADPATPPEMLKAIANGVRDGHYVILDGAAHLPNVERADEVTRALAEHLGRCSEAPATR